MAGAVQRAAVVGPDGAIAIRVPEPAPGQRVRITVEVEREPAELCAAIAVLAELLGPLNEEGHRQTVLEITQA